MDTDALNFLPSSLSERIAALHGGAERGYHAWSHPLALLELHREVAGHFHDPDAVAAAIILHDAIYDARRSDNEERSAALAVELLTPYLPADRVQRVRRLIEATARHIVPAGLEAGETADIQLFLDMDLSILGASAADFDAYEAGVRHEYRHIHSALFAARRAKILDGFLSRPRLYLTDWGRDRFEGQARDNIRRSIARLRG